MIPNAIKINLYHWNIPNVERFMRDITGFSVITFKSVLRFVINKKVDDICEVAQVVEHMPSM